MSYKRTHSADLRIRGCFHCEPIEKVADEFIQECHMNSGTFDNVQACRYKIPDYWDIGEVYERLIEDCYDDHKIVDGIWKVYHSWIDAQISNYNSDFLLSAERLYCSVL